MLEALKAGTLQNSSQAPASGVQDVMAALDNFGGRDLKPEGGGGTQEGQGSDLLRLPVPKPSFPPHGLIVGDVVKVDSGFLAAGNKRGSCGIASKVYVWKPLL